eukprot:Blabericola_migrator_1__4470@NODE_238_length_10988_cov_97_569087_g202_i0_p8_GENE_NODE_238_length_10988_cov_97_569087_g202_i0NODE_238_length_10988_cov_97_569087_g202_i0_p8_ORF_typecomplete_len199_score29_32_NODE_238_length_10988_cov_97_569087_g202_i049265522
MIGIPAGSKFCSMDGWKPSDEDTDDLLSDSTSDEDDEKVQAEKKEEPDRPYYMKYGDHYYPEETVPEAYTLTDANQNICRYIAGFLIYNRKGERLTNLETLPTNAIFSSASTNVLCVFGALLPAVCIQKPEIGRLVKRNLKRRKHRRQELPSNLNPYPARIQIDQYKFDYGSQPQDPPHIWVRSVRNVWYRSVGICGG